MLRLPDNATADHRPICKLRRDPGSSSEHCTWGLANLVPVDAQPHAPRRRVWDLEPVASVAGRSGEANIVYGYECGSELSKKSTLHVGFPQGPR